MPLFRSSVTEPVSQAHGAPNRTLAEQAADAILQAIARGTLLPGDPVIESYIARDLGFSRVPVREALRRLESQGLIEGGSPRQCARLIEPTQRDVDELIEVRRTLELMALRHALIREGGVARWKVMRRAVKEGSKAARARNEAAMLAADRLFHRSLWEAAGNALLLSSLLQLAQRQMLMWGAVRDNVAFDIAQAEHQAIFRALETGKQDEAEQLLAKHVRWHRGEDFAKALAGARRKRALLGSRGQP